MNITKKFPNLHALLGSGFHQDWMEEHSNENEVIEAYVRDDAKSAFRTLHELDQLLALGLPEAELDRVVYREMGCEYDPERKWKTMSNWLHWVRDTMAKYAAEKSTEEKKSQGKQ